MKDSLKSYHVSGGVKKMLWFFGEHAFSAILFFILIDMIIGALIIYIYIILPQGKNLTPTGESFKFREDVYQKVIIQQERNRQYFNIDVQNTEESLPEPGL